MRILIADDHPFIRKGIRETLAESLSMLQIEEAGDGSQAFGLLSSRQYDLAVVDISMPGKDGLDLIKDTLAAKPGVRFLVMSAYPEREFAERAYRIGAKGFIAKSSPLSEFLEAVRRILGGGTYVSQEFAESLALGLGRGSDQGLQLSDRELAVLGRLASGESLTHIGLELHLSVKTVSTYKARAMEKLGLENNAELLAYALSHGLSGPPAL